MFGETIEEITKHSEMVMDGEDKKGRGFVLLGGWESLDAHMEFRETERFEKNVGFLRGNHGGVEMVSSLLEDGGVRRVLMCDSFMLRSRLLELNFWLFDIFSVEIRALFA